MYELRTLTVSFAPPDHAETTAPRWDIGFDEEEEIFELTRTSPRQRIETILLIGWDEWLEIIEAFQADQHELSADPANSYTTAGLTDPNGTESTQWIVPLQFVLYLINQLLIESGHFDDATKTSFNHDLDYWAAQASSN